MIMTKALAWKLVPEARELVGLASEEWCESYDTAKGRAEICIRDAATGEVTPIAAILPDCGYDDRRLLFKAPLLLRALLFLLEEAIDIIRRLQPPEDKPKAKRKQTPANLCALKCNNQAFRRYLMECHDLQDAGDVERVKTRVRNILIIQSMKELDEDPDARKRWQKLLGDFEVWMRR